MNLLKQFQMDNTFIIIFINTRIRFISQHIIRFFLNHLQKDRDIYMEIFQKQMKKNNQKLAEIQYYLIFLIIQLVLQIILKFSHKILIKLNKNNKLLSNKSIVIYTVNNMTQLLLKIILIKIVMFIMEIIVNNY